MSPVAHLDNAQLRRVLGLRCVESRCVATGIEHDCHWTLMVSISVVYGVVAHFDPRAVYRRQALPAIAVGHIIISIVMVLNGTPGARLHVGFPVLNRSSFGFWFSYLSVISRIVLSMFWLGIQSYTGSQCVYQVCGRLNIHSYKYNRNTRADAEGDLAVICQATQRTFSWGAHHNLRNALLLLVSLHPCESDNLWLEPVIDTSLQFPLMFVSPQRIRWLFLLKALIVPPAWIAILIWAFVKVPPSKGLFEQNSILSGSALSYAWLSALNSALGIYSTLAVNIPDFTVRLFLVP